ncbi:effector-associated constant component EACC1 [Streptomyces cupreus]|uniref:Uncharacterized protein n=1 Tax=Streptomyces cupreus TaxID=2759956 RepID=A0A7X1MFH9_9ACTN|nr:hypothetical protein [Streptomyces cupreus]
MGRGTRNCCRQALRSLYLWLRDDPRVRGGARVEVRAEQPEPGRMGSALDCVQLVLDSGFQLANLAVARAAWRATRPARPEITFERDGVKVTLSGQDPETAARLLAELER